MKFAKIKRQLRQEIAESQQLIARLEESNERLLAKRYTPLSATNIQEQNRAIEDLKKEAKMLQSLLASAYTLQLYILINKSQNPRRTTNLNETLNQQFNLTPHLTTEAQQYEGKHLH